MAARKQNGEEEEKDEEREEQIEEQIEEKIKPTVWEDSVGLNGRRYQEMAMAGIYPRQHPEQRRRRKQRNNKNRKKRRRSLWYSAPQNGVDTKNKGYRVEADTSKDI